MKLFATSDMHYFHKNIIKYAERPFDINDENCVRDNAELMHNNYNKIINDDDYVLIVGDMSAGLNKRQAVFSELLKTLKGNKILIRGNHDHEPDQFYLDAGFIMVLDYIIFNDYFICHYPCFKSEWNKGKEPEYIRKLEKTNCSKIIHGHVHNKDPSLWKPDGYSRKNVCVDFKPNNFYPIELQDTHLKEYIIKIAKV